MTGCSGNWTAPIREAICPSVKKMKSGMENLPGFLYERYRPVNKLEFVGMPRRAMRACQAGSFRYAIGPSRFGTLAAKLEFIDLLERWHPDGCQGYGLHHRHSLRSPHQCAHWFAMTFFSAHSAPFLAQPTTSLHVIARRPERPTWQSVTPNKTPNCNLTGAVCNALAVGPCRQKGYRDQRRSDTEQSEQVTTMAAPSTPCPPGHPGEFHTPSG